MTNQKIIAAFGELMLRIAAPDKKRLLQTLHGNLVATYGGGEANVCASLGVLGMPVRYLTALPDNPVASAAIAELRKLCYGVFQLSQYPPREKPQRSF